ncbi:hypothetical protein D1872_145230 [compost metagenome]
MTLLNKGEFQLINIIKNLQFHIYLDIEGSFFINLPYHIIFLPVAADSSMQSSS